jgi:hypothetical protein
MNRPPAAGVSEVLRLDEVGEGTSGSSRRVVQRCEIGELADVTLVWLNDSDDV